MRKSQNWVNMVKIEKQYNMSIYYNRNNLSKGKEGLPTYNTGCFSVWRVIILG